MSETDDTDVLLLIPPDFFLVQSSDSSCVETARTVVARPPPSRRALSALHASLGSLEHRVRSLELSTSPRSRHSSLLSEKGHHSLELNSEDRRSYTFPRRRRRKVFSRRNKYLDTSLASTRSSSFGEERVPALSLPESAPRLSESFAATDIAYSVESHIDNSIAMDSEISSVVSSPSKKNDKLLLNEIDDFLNKVESYEGPDARFKVPEIPDNIIKATGDYLSHKLENSSSNRVTLPSGRTVPHEFLEKYIYLVNNSQSNAPSTSGHPQRAERLENPPLTEVTPKESRPTQPDLKNSVRKLNFSERDMQPTSTPNPNRLTRARTAPNTESFHPSCNRVHEKASKVFEQYKVPSISNYDTLSNVSSYPSPQKDDFKYRRYEPGRGQKANDDYRSRGASESKYPHSVDTDLLSLSELWCEQDGQKNETAKLEEERLKREHCEAVIQGLQKKMLEQQERLAVAVQVDRAKDNAISRLRDAWGRVTGSLEAAEARHKAALMKMNAEMSKLRQSAEESHKKTRHFENEMYKTLDLAHDYQEKCKMAQQERRQLEEQAEKSTAESGELVKKKEQEMASLREDYESVLRLNKQLTDCVKNAEEALEKEKSSHMETRTELSSAHKLTQEFEEELTLVRQERDLLKEKAKEERSRVAILEKQIAEAQCRLGDVHKRENALDTEVKTLRRHLELQKDDLKSHYQRQLEEAVLAKLREFQQQLDAAEREMEREARAREGGLVDTYNKRIQRLEEQHKLEVSVLEEKQKEEMKLYRLQLAQAGEKISALENKVESYRRRRGQIAAQLHGVMESQWRQALDILTCAAPSADTSAHRHNVYPQHSPADFRQAATPREAQPTLDKLSAPSLLADRKYNADGLSDTEIQHYVKMLLSKPPEFLDGSGGSDDAQVKCEPRDAAEEPTSDRAPDERPGHRGKRSLNGSKPPWKA